jgi:hypothetical protein
VGISLRDSKQALGAASSFAVAVAAGNSTSATMSWVLVQSNFATVAGVATTIGAPLATHFVGDPSLAPGACLSLDGHQLATVFAAALCIDERGVAATAGTSACRPTRHVQAINGQVDGKIQVFVRQVAQCAPGYHAAATVVVEFALGWLLPHPGDDADRYPRGVAATRSQDQRADEARVLFTGHGAHRRGPFFKLGKFRNRDVHTVDGVAVEIGGDPQGDLRRLFTTAEAQGEDT